MESLAKNKDGELFQVNKNILLLLYNDDIYLEKQNFLDILSAIRKHPQEQGKVAQIVNAPNNMNFEMDTWEYVSNNNYEDELFSVVAVYTTALQHKIMSSSYHRKVQPSIPSKTFNTYEEALNWVSSLVKTNY